MAGEFGDDDRIGLSLLGAAIKVVEADTAGPEYLHTPAQLGELGQHNTVFVVNCRDEPHRREPSRRHGCHTSLYDRTRPETFPFAI